MTVNIICDKDDLVGFIGLEVDEGTIKPADTPGLIEFGATVECEKLIELRDRLIEMFPIEEKAEDVPEWRRADEWKETREGDYAEFDEPKDGGYYATQSGIILRNDGDGRRNWYLLVDQGRGRFDCANWTEVLDMLADSEFPLVKLTPEILRKAVKE